MPIDLTKIQIPFLRDGDIRGRADEFRRQYWGERIPVDVELIAERDLHLLMIPMAGLRSMVHTDAFLSGDLKEIVYDPAVPDVRVRFSVAHEIGHLILHRDIIEKVRPSSYREWEDLQHDLPDAIWGRAEYQAREFAGRLLIPPELLINALKELRPAVAKALTIVPGLELPVLRELVSPKLAKRFFVSDQVIVRRMEVENISPVQE